MVSPAPYPNLISGSRTADVDPRTLVPHPHNWRRHPDQQRAAMDGLLAEIGWVQRILVSEASGYIVNGHLRRELAIARGDPTVPVEYVPGLTPEQEDLLIVTFDTVTTLHGTDEDLLRAALESIQTANQQVADLLGIIGQTYLPAIPRERREDPGARIEEMDALRQEFGSERGVLWLCGPHRLLCGDATDHADVARVLDGARPALMVTDPPYGVDYDPGWRQDYGINNSGRTGAVQNDDRADWRAAWSLSPAEIAYTWYASLQSAQAQLALQAVGFEVRDQIIWAKPAPAISRGHYNWQHEPCWYAVRKGKTARWQGGHSETTMWYIGAVTDAQQDETTVHGTQKPLEAMARPIRNHEGDVYDPFVGSGTTMVAAEQEGRTCYAMDLDPGYVAVALDRMRRMGLDVRRATEDG